MQDHGWEDRFRGFTSLLPVEYTMDAKPKSAITSSGEQTLALAPSTLQSINQSSPEGALAVSSQDNPIITEKDGSRKFLMEFDVRQFKPDEINVRTENKVLSIHAVQEFKEGSKEEYREFARQFVLPSDLDDDHLESHLSPDGVLTVTAPLPAIKPAIEAGPRSSLKAITIDRR